MKVNDVLMLGMVFDLISHNTKMPNIDQRLENDIYIVSVQRI